MKTSLKALVCMLCVSGYCQWFCFWQEGVGRGLTPADAVADWKQRA